jgi:hypothetical protein
MNRDTADELSVVRQLLQEALARAERAEAECEALRQRPSGLAAHAFGAQGRRIDEVMRELEEACRELSRLRGGTDIDGEGF